MLIKKGVGVLIEHQRISIDGQSFQAVTEKLPKTTLLTVSNDKGYIMCGALDVGLLNKRASGPQNCCGSCCWRKNY